MKRVYEAWYDPRDNSTLLTTPETIRQELERGDLSPKAVLLHRIEADTWEEAQAVHTIKRGWGSYDPTGEAQPCPNYCGAMFYPEGSGECPNCGRIC